MPAHRTEGGVEVFRGVGKSGDCVPGWNLDKVAAGSPNGQQQQPVFFCRRQPAITAGNKRDEGHSDLNPQITIATNRVNMQSNICFGADDQRRARAQG